MDEIKTEVDRLIELLQNSKGRTMRLSEVASLSGLSIPQARKWIHILEERGQARVSYNLADEEVSWVSAARPGAGRGPAHSASFAPTGAEGGGAHMEAARFMEQRYRQMYPGAGAPQPPPGDDESRKKDAASRLAHPAESIPFSPPSPARKPEPISQESQPPYSKPKAEPEPEELPEPALPPLPKMDEKAMRMSQALKGKIAQARAKREEIEKLKGEKKRMLVEVYRPLETRLEQEAGAITEKLIELENQLLSIREQASRVPGEVSELAGEQERIVQVASEMQRLYADTDRQMTHSMNVLKQARQGAQERLEQARATMNEEAARLEQMNGLSAELQELQAQIEERIREAQEALQSQAARVKAGEEGLREIGRLRAQMQEQAGAGSQELEKQKAALEEIERQLGRLDEVQHWAEAHQLEYNERMQRLRQYISESGAQYHKLKAAIDSGFVHKYLRDLRALSESYDFELSQAQRIETNVDQRIEETKKELAALIAQAR